MKTRLLVATLFAASCGAPQSPPPAAPAPSAAPAPAARPTPPRPKPVYGAWGFDRAGMDPTTSPNANFYRYADGGWLKTTAIPPDKSNYGMFSALEDLSETRTKEIILNARGEPGSEERKIADFYGSFMDEAAIEAKGLAPLKADLDRIATIKSPRVLTRVLALSARRLQTTPFETMVLQDDRDPEHYIANLGQGGLGLPDRDMYDVTAKQFDAARAGYKKYIATILGLAGVKHPEKRAAAIYALEEKIAATHWTRTQNRDAQKTYNKMTVAELKKLAPAVDWKEWLATVGLAGQPALNVNQPSAIAGMAKLVRRVPLAVWRDYLTFHLISDAAPYLPKRFVDARFELYGKVLSGTPEIRARWKRGVNAVRHAMGEAVGKIYVAKYFTPATKARADQLVRNLLTAMGQRLDRLTWMSPATKAKAKAKLASYNPKIGYPKKWRDYSKLQVVAGDPVGNAARAAAFEYDRRLAKLGQPVDRDEWVMPPMMVNAYYNPVLNEIVFPAAILQPPFFDPNADDAVNYGGIGAVIGHEISHGFDDQGSQYDARGALKNWWTTEDQTKFKAAAAKLVAQYDAYCPIPAADGKPAQCVKGKLTLGENIADLAGLTVAHTAYHLALGGKPAPVIDGLSGDQRFFLGWAQVWRRKYRLPELARRLVIDPHSPSEYRANVVRNLDQWYAAYGAKPSDRMFLPPEQRVRIW